MVTSVPATAPSVRSPPAVMVTKSPGAAALVPARISEVLSALTGPLFAVRVTPAAPVGPPPLSELIVTLGPTVIPVWPVMVIGPALETFAWTFAP